MQLSLGFCREEKLYRRTAPHLVRQRAIRSCTRALFDQKVEECSMHPTFVYAKMNASNRDQIAFKNQHRPRLEENDILSLFRQQFEIHNGIKFCVFSMRVL